MEATERDGAIPNEMDANASQRKEEGPMTAGTVTGPGAKIKEL